jgi:hypothetical protein
VTSISGDIELPHYLMIRTIIVAARSPKATVFGKLIDNLNQGLAIVACF